MHLNVSIFDHLVQSIAFYLSLIMRLAQPLLVEQDLLPNRIDLYAHL